MGCCTPKGRGNELDAIMEQMFGAPRMPNRELLVRGFPVTDIKVHKENKNTIIDLFLAGFKKEDISIDVENGVLVISGEMKKASEESEFAYSVKQSSSKSFRRVFNLQEDIENISAEMVDGVLSITLVPVAPVEVKKLSTKIEIK